METPSPPPLKKEENKQNKNSKKLKLTNKQRKNQYQKNKTPKNPPPQTMIKKNYKYSYFIRFLQICMGRK